MRLRETKKGAGTMKYQLNIKKVRGWYRVYAGESKLGRGFRTLEECERDLEKNRALYRCWAGSVSTSYFNRMAKGEYTTIYTDGTVKKGV